MMRRAYEIFSRIAGNGAYANLALKTGLKGADSREAGRVTALVYGTLEHLSYVDFIIDAYKKGRLHGSIRNVLRLSLTRLLFMSDPAHAAVTEAVELTKAIGKASLAGFVNGILRAVVRDSSEDKLPPLPKDTAERLSVLYTMPRFMVSEYLSDYGESFTESLLSTRLHTMTVRAQFPFDSAALERELTKLGIPYRRGKYDENAFLLDEGADIPSLELFKNGQITVQSESAMFACRACGVKDGMTVLDACAAPGGKTAYLSSLMHGTGMITAWELHPHRAELIKATLKRLKCENCRVLTRDAAKPPETDESYDVVLCDVPCSGLGGAGKPDAMLNRTEEDIASLVSTQRAILDNAAKLVKKGGALVYSTCTVSRRENLENARYFLNTQPSFEAVDLSPLAGKESSAEAPFLQLLANRDGVEGFFIAKFIRKEL